MTVLFSNLQDYKLIVMKICKCGLLESAIEMALLWPWVALGANPVVSVPTCPAVSCRSASVLFSRKNMYGMVELYVK